MCVLKQENAKIGLYNAIIYTADSHRFISLGYSKTLPCMCNTCTCISVEESHIHMIRLFKDTAFFPISNKSVEEYLVQLFIIAVLWDLTYDCMS